MEKIEKLFKNNGNCSTIEEYEQQEKLINESNDVQVNLKEENGYIDIEYYNQVGEYKAKVLIEVFNKHKEFYQYFLSHYQKVIIQTNRKRNNTGEIVINNEPCSIDLEDLLKQILSPYPIQYSSYILEKTRDGKNLLSEEQAIDLIRWKILKKDVDEKKIDFFKYLDLMNGKFIDTTFYYELAVIDLSFQIHCYSLLEDYMNNKDKEIIHEEVFKTLHSQYGLILLNYSLEHQKELLLRYQKRYNDTFLAENLNALNNLFSEQIFEIAQHINFDLEWNPISITKQQCLDLTIEFLQEIDSTGGLIQELNENMDNGSIILWNPQDKNTRKKMQEKYGKKFCIDEPLCCSEYDDGNLTSITLNLPLQFNLKDVFSLVHEFLHFHSDTFVPRKIKNQILKEFPSIYFENLVLNFLKKKGYSSENLPINFRMLDSISNYCNFLPIFMYFSQYMENREINLGFIHKQIIELQDVSFKLYDQLGIYGEQRKKELEKMGIYENIEHSVYLRIYNLNNILLRSDESIYQDSPYLLGTILTKSANMAGISPQEILQISNRLTQIGDPCEIMEIVGIDPSKYGFKSPQSSKSSTLKKQLKRKPKSENETLLSVKDE